METVTVKVFNETVTHHTYVWWENDGNTHPYWLIDKLETNYMDELPNPKPGEEITGIEVTYNPDKRKILNISIPE